MINRLLGRLGKTSRFALTVRRLVFGYRYAKATHKNNPLAWSIRFAAKL